jgi:hypothetical protein
VAAALIGFFLPWATLDIKTTGAEKPIASSARRSLSKTFTSVKPGANAPAWKPSKGLPVIVHVLPDSLQQRVRRLLPG